MDTERYHPNAKPVDSCSYSGCSEEYAPNTGWSNGMCLPHAGKVRSDAYKVRTLEPGPTTQTCSKCQEDKVLDLFVKDRRRKYGRSGVCKQCDLARAAQYRQTSSGRQVYRNMHLRKKFGIYQGDYDKLLESQGQSCAICDSKEPGSKRSNFFVDHNHLTGAVRGLLCSKCNTAIGLLNSDQGTELIESALRYTLLYQEIGDKN